MDRESWTVIGVGVALLGVLLPFNLYLVHNNANTLKDHFNQLLDRLEDRMTLLEQSQQVAVARLEDRMTLLEQSQQAAVTRLEQSQQDAVARLEQSQQAAVARLEQSQQDAVARLEQSQQDAVARLEQSQQRATEKMERSLETQRQELQAIGERTARIEGALTGPWDARNGERMPSALSRES